MSKGTIQSGNQIPALSGGVIASVLLGPGLVLSLLGTNSVLASEGRTPEAITTNVILALFNLCALLPIIILIGMARPGLREYFIQWRQGVATTQSISETVVNLAEPILYPMRVWRVDTVILIVLSLVLIPASGANWRLGKREGAGLILAYVAYLMLVTGFAARSY
jgi:Ca2+/Na+ antiporter